MNNFYASLKGMVVLMLVMCWGVGFGQPGTLDVSFGDSGKVITSQASKISIEGHALAIQADGKIIVTGIETAINLANIILVRYLSTGIIDSSFGIYGVVKTKIDSGGNNASSIVLQSDGKIIVGGYSTPDFQASSNQNLALARYKIDGSIDSSFGVNGFVVTDLAGGTSRDVIYKILVKSNGKILAGGFSLDQSVGLSSYGFVLAQYNTNGSLDSTFGINGLIKTTQMGYRVYGSIGLQSNGKIIAINSVKANSSGSSNIKYGVMRFMPNGMVDSLFGTNGLIISSFGNEDDFGFELAIQTDDKILATGVTNQAGQLKSGTVRYSPDGIIDSTFASNGKLIISLSNMDDSGNRIFVQADGKVLISATANTGNRRADFAIIRVNSNGSIDSSFGTNGTTITDFVGTEDECFSSIIDSLGKIILVGSSISPSTGRGFALARYNNNIVTLPLHLLTFTAKKDNNINQLNWTTAQEVNTDRFEIERSGNSREFSKIGVVKAGNTNYTFTDNNPLKAVNYYRLKMLDKDGQFTYSPIRSLTINNSPLTIAIFPNPAHNKLQLQINSGQKINLQLDIITQDGKVVLSSNMAAASGSMLRSINIVALQSGIYFLRATSGAGEQSVVKFEKL